MEITTGTKASRLFDYMKIIFGTRARLFDYMEIITGTRTRLFGIIVFFLWVYDMVHKKSRNFLLN